MKKGYKGLLVLSMAFLLAGCNAPSTTSSQATSQASEQASSEVVSSEAASSEEASSEVVVSSEVASSEEASSEEVSSEASSVEESSTVSKNYDTTAENDQAVVMSELPDGDITEDVTVDIFTFVKNADTTETSAKKAMTVADCDVTYNELSYSKVLKTQSASSTKEGAVARVISFTATGKGKVTILAKSGGDDERSIGLLNADKGVEHDSKKVGTEVTAIELEFHYSGTYYITSAANVSIYKISASWEDGVNEQWSPSISLSDANVLNVGELPSQTYSENATAGNFTINAVESYTKEDETTDTGTVIVEANSKTYDKVSYTKRLKLGGVGSLTYRSITMHVTGECTVNVICMSSNSSTETTANIFNASGEAVCEEATIATTLSGYTFAIEEAGDYTFWGTGAKGVNVYCISINY